MFFSLSGKIFSHLQKVFVSSFLFCVTVCENGKIAHFLCRASRKMVIIVTYETRGGGTH